MQMYIFPLQYHLFYIQLTHDHPVMVEWLKTCQGVKVLRDSVINVLCQSGQYRSVADELLAINIPSINRYEF